MSADRPPRGPSDPLDSRPECEEVTPAGGVDRRTLFRLGALAGAGASMAGAAAWNGSPRPGPEGGGRAGGRRAVPEARRPPARARRARGRRGPLPGIPITLKDNIAPADKMHTTAGSFALLGPAAPQDATVAARLRAAGAIILGKAGLSEWANFRSTHSSSGWSGRGGQGRNPYYLHRNPPGSAPPPAAPAPAPLPHPTARKGPRLGVARQTFTGANEKTDAGFEEAIAIAKSAGAVIIDPTDLPSAADLFAGVDEVTVLFYDFPIDVAAYLATRTGLSVHNLDDLIAFNDAHADIEMQYFGQEIFLICQNSGVTAAQAAQSVINAHKLARDQGIDAVLQQFNLHAIITPTNQPSWTTDLIDGDHFQVADSTPAAVAGYPHITVPGGSAFGLPLGLSFTGTAWSEPKLIALAFSFEQAAQARLEPKLLPTLPGNVRVGSKRQPTAAPAMSNRLANWLGAPPSGSPGPPPP